MGYKVKRIMVWQNGEEKQVRPGKVQTFDFQNNGSLNWTGGSIGAGTPYHVSNQGWTIGNGDGNYQGTIIPPSSVFDGKKLQKIKVYMYKGVDSTVRNRNVGIGPSTTTNNNLRPHCIWCVGSGNIQSAQCRVQQANGTSSMVSTVDLTGEVTQEWIFNDDGTAQLILNGTNTYNLGNISEQFRDEWTNKTLGLTIGRRGPLSDNDKLYLRKVEITTE